MIESSWGADGSFLSAWRPGEGATAEDVDVEVGDGFAAVGAVVDHDAVTGGEVELTGHRAGGEQEVAKERLVIGRGGADARDDLFRDDEEVRGRLRRDVVKDDAEVVFVLDLGGDFAGNDAFEEGGHGGGGVAAEGRMSNEE